MTFIVTIKLSPGFSIELRQRLWGMLSCLMKSLLSDNHVQLLNYYIIEISIAKWFNYIRRWRDIGAIISTELMFPVWWESVL